MRQGSQWRCIAALAMLLAGSVAPAQTLGPTFTYQGQIKENGQVLNGTADLVFRLYSTATGGTPLGTVVLPATPVVDGLFTAHLNSASEFGPTAFNGEARWLEIQVNGTTLSPRQPLHATPYAQRASGNWSLTGNAATNPSTHFLGTTDLQPLVLRTNNTPGFRLEWSQGGGISGINVVGGHWFNSVTAGATGCTVFGGVTLQVWLYSNSATDRAATISGGYGHTAGNNNGDVEDAEGATIGGGVLNTASGAFSVISGGTNNFALTPYAVVGGGEDNHAVGFDTTIAGGRSNVAEGISATIGGGTRNTAMGDGATVPGGQLNRAAGIYSFAAGRRAKADHAGSFVWADNEEADFGSTGAKQFLIRAAGGVGIGTNQPRGSLHVVHPDPSTGWGVRVQNSAQGTYQGGMRLSTSGFFEVTNDALNPAANFARLNSAGNWTSVSDRRTKTDIAPLKDVLDRAMALQPVGFRYRNASSGAPSAPQIGFVAQDVRPLFPSLVSEGGDLLTLDYGGMSVVAIAALQEHKRQADARIADLEAQNAALKARLERLEALMLRGARD